MSRRVLSTIRWVALAGCLLSVAASAQEGGPLPLPSPLTLEQALQLADQSHPTTDLASAELQQARAEQAAVAAEDDLRFRLNASLRAIEPSPLAEDQSPYDHWAYFRLSKQLSDFGRTARAEAAAEAASESRAWRLYSARQQRRLQVMARFFDVLLADLEFARDNEAMSIAYVRLDRARSRNELGQLSDIELLARETDYQQARRRMHGSRQQQRITRSLLALSLNRPDDLPSDLVYPAATEPVPEQEIERLTQRALAANPGLLALRADLEAVEHRMGAAAARDNPVLRAELEAASYNRDLGGRNPLSAGLVLEVPLFSGNRVGAQVAKERARLQEYRAKLAVYELDLRQQILELWLELQRRQIRQEELMVSGDYRDLYLDRSRSLYELEVASDLGDSMVQTTELRLEQAENDFQIRLLRAKLNALTGTLLTQNNRPHEEGN